MRHRFWRSLGAVLGVAGLFLAAVAVRAQSEPTPTPTPYSAVAVRAAFLINFAKFTQWPDLPEGTEATPIVFGVVGDKELEDNLWRLTSGQRISGHPIRLRRLLTPQDGVGCHVLYLGQREAEARREWLELVQGLPVLVVGSEPGFLREGGIIRFYVEGKNLRFEIDAKRAAEARLQISSRLLALSRPPSKPAASP